jgi:DNA-binding transcriptional LysR family regulator
VEGVANGSLDLATVRLEQQEILELARRPLFVEDLYEDPLVLVASPGAPGFDEFQAVTEKTVPPKVMTRLTLILPEPHSGIRRDLDRRFRDAGVVDRLRIAVEAGPWQTAVAYVRDGVGVGVVPRSAVAGVSGLVVKSLPPKLSPANTVRAICRKRAGSEDLDLSEGAQAFLQALRDAASKVAA